MNRRSNLAFLLVVASLLSGCAARRPAYAGRLIEEDSDDLAEDSPTASDLRAAAHEALEELHVQHARWNGKRFTCPSGTALWASEPEAIDGRSDYVYCVKR
jgi:hypothetical protein